MFGIADFGAFCAAVLVFLALPGPGTLVLLASTARGGFRAGAAATAGLIGGDQVLLWLAVAGVAAVLAARPELFAAVQYAGAAYLGWLGLRLLFGRNTAAATTSTAAAAPPDRRRRTGALTHLRQAFLVTLLNPKAIVFYMAFFPLFIDPATHRGVATFGAMAVTVALLTALWCLTLCAFADAIARRLGRHRRLADALRRAAGVFLIAFGWRLVRG